MNTKISFKFTFDDYLTFCKILSKKPSDYKNLIEYKKFLKYLESH